MECGMHGASKRAQNHSSMVYQQRQQQQTQKWQQKGKWTPSKRRKPGGKWALTQENGHSLKICKKKTTRSDFWAHFGQGANLRNVMQRCKWVGQRKVFWHFATSLVLSRRDRVKREGRRLGWAARKCQPCQSEKERMGDSWERLCKSQSVWQELAELWEEVKRCQLPERKKNIKSSFSFVFFFQLLFFFLIWVRDYGWATSFSGSWPRAGGCAVTQGSDTIFGSKKKPR